MEPKQDDDPSEKRQKVEKLEDLPTVDEDGKPILFNGVEVSKLTKTQLKKYRRVLKWQAEKKEKRLRERLKQRKKIAEAKRNNLDIGPSRKQLKEMRMDRSPCKVHVVIDLSFNDLMIDKDMGKLTKQVLRVYTENRRSATPMQLHLTSFEGRAKEEMAKHDGHQHWDVYFHAEPYIDVFPKEKLVYLTSESSNVISKLEDDDVYIIGGLVDHNSQKGICYRKAVEQGIRHAQLPISEYFHIEHRKVFTVNQVFEILLRVIEGKTFKEALQSVLPKRINMQPTTKEEISEEQSETVQEDVNANG